MAVVIVALSVLIGFMDCNNRKERKSLMNAVIAKNNQELVNLELADKTVVDTKDIAKEVDDLFVPTDSLSDDEYDKMIRKSIE